MKEHDVLQQAVTQSLKVARVWTEMVRPYVHHTKETPWSGYDYVTLRLAGLARAVQSRLCLHTCSLRYCQRLNCACAWSTAQRVGMLVSIGTHGTPMIPDAEAC